VLFGRCDFYTLDDLVQETGQPKVGLQGKALVCSGSLPCGACGGWQAHLRNVLERIAVSDTAGPNRHKSALPASPFCRDPWDRAGGWRSRFFLAGAGGLWGRWRLKDELRSNF
jgi:hypothetical protein